MRALDVGGTTNWQLLSIYICYQACREGRIFLIIGKQINLKHFRLLD